MATKKSNGAARKPTEVETTTRKCLVQLTAAERDERSVEMSKCELVIETLKGEQSELGRAVKNHARRRNELGHALDKGSEERELLCTWVPDYAKNVFRLTRPDTREVIDTRPMSAVDRNVDLFPDAVDTKLPKPPRAPRAKTKHAAPTLTSVPDSAA
jgi:hypothetical protein